MVNPNNPPGFLVYSTYFGGTDGEVAYDVKSDSTGNIYFTGYTLSSDLTTEGAPSPDGAAASMFSSPASNPGRPAAPACSTAPISAPPAPMSAARWRWEPDGSIYVGGYGNIGLPSSSNGNGFSGGVTDGFITVMK